MNVPIDSWEFHGPDVALSVAARSQSPQKMSFKEFEEALTVRKGSNHDMFIKQSPKYLSNKKRHYDSVNLRLSSIA